MRHLFALVLPCGPLTASLKTPAEKEKAMLSSVLGN